ncbi:MAG: hypothetical protein ACQETM_11395, partial [Bacteroidota bacterium]
ALTPAFLRVKEDLEEQRKELLMTSREWDKYQAVRESSVDPGSARADEIRKMVDLLHDMREAAAWDEKAGAPAGIGPAGVSGADDQWAKDQMEKSEEIGNKWDETYDHMANAFDGWATSYSRTLNDMLWESELTFDGILQSFGRMVTEMMIQSAMSDVTGALFGSAGGGEGAGLLKTVASSAIGAFSGAVGGSNTAVSAMDAMYGFDKGGRLPADVFGFDKQGRTYQMHKGETIQPTHKNKSAGKAQYNTFNITVQAPEGNLSKQSQRQLRRQLTRSVSAANRGM